MKKLGNLIFSRAMPSLSARLPRFSSATVVSTAFSSPKNLLVNLIQLPLHEQALRRRASSQSARAQLPGSGKHTVRKHHAYMDCHLHNKHPNIAHRIPDFVQHHASTRTINSPCPVLKIIHRQRLDIIKQILTQLRADF